MAVALMTIVLGVAAAVVGMQPAPGVGDGAVRPALIVIPNGAQEVQPGAQPEAQPEAGIETTDDLLMALERSGEDLQSFQADIIYTKLFPFEGDEQTREGKLYYVVEEPVESGEPRRKFAVHFNVLIFDDRIERGEDRSYVFDGRWLVEKLHKERQMFRREVVPPGETFDPLRLGEGPFPIPIGQKREQILERFEAELLPAEDGIDRFDSKIAAWLTSEHYPTYQLRLTPRPEFEGELDLAEIRIWYRKDNLLPRAAWTRAVNGNESTIRLTKQEAGGEVPRDVLDTRVPGPDWDVETTPWRGEAGGGGL